MDADDAVRVRDAWRDLVEACPYRPWWRPRGLRILRGDGSIARAGFALTCDSSMCRGTFQRRSEAAFGFCSVHVQLLGAVGAAIALLP